MKKWFPLSLLLFFSTILCWAQAPQTPDQIYGQLFTDVQMNKIFPDNKTFVDCVPKRNPKEIVTDYEKLKKDSASGFSLQHFVESNFQIPVSPTSTYQSDKNGTAAAHIQQLWSVLKRNPDKEVEGKFFIATSVSLHRSGWQISGNLLLGFLFYNARVASKR